MPRESSSPEDGHGGQVRVKVNSHADHKLMIRIRELSLLIVSMTSFLDLGKLPV